MCRKANLFIFSLGRTHTVGMQREPFSWLLYMHMDFFLHLFTKAKTLFLKYVYKIGQTSAVVLVLSLPFFEKIRAQTGNTTRRQKDQEGPKVSPHTPLISLEYNGVELECSAFDKWPSTWDRQARSTAKIHLDVPSHFYFHCLPGIQWEQYQISHRYFLLHPLMLKESKKSHHTAPQKGFSSQNKTILIHVATCPWH